MSTYSRFHTGYKIDPISGCWIWIKSKDKNGYGYIKHNGKTVKTHRVSLLLTGTVIQDNMVLHRCDNPSCVNPDHLFLGTAKDNMQDMIQKGRQNYVGSSQPKETNPNAKLTQTDINTIRDLKRTLTLKQLSLLYRVSTTHISRICTRRSWK